MFTIKERSLAKINPRSFEKYPHQHIPEIIYNTIFWLLFSTQKWHTPYIQDQQLITTNIIGYHLAHVQVYNNTIIQ